MKEPHWITREVILATQEELLERFGGLAGVRDEGLLKSALKQPRDLFAQGETSLFMLATAYAYGIARDRPFQGGNKTSGFKAATLFLELNGVRFQASGEDVVERTLALAAGAIPAADYAVWLQRSTTST